MLPCLVCETKTVFEALAHVRVELADSVGVRRSLSRQGGCATKSLALLASSSLAS